MYVGSILISVSGPVPVLALDMSHKRNFNVLNSHYHIRKLFLLYAVHGLTCVCTQFRFLLMKESL